VRTLEEKPERSAATHASMGIYVFEFDVLGEMLRSRPVDLVLDVLRPLVDAGERVYSHEFNGFWEDVGTVASYYRTNLELVQPEPRLQLYDGRWPILTRDEERPAVVVGPSGAIEESLVANGCRIDGHVRRSILFPGVNVGRDAEILDSVVMADNVIEPRARVERAILDKYGRIGEGAIVGEGEQPGPPDLHWLAGLVLVGKDAWIPAGGRVQRPASIGVGGRYEDFQDGVLPAGSLVGNRRWYEELR